VRIKKDWRRGVAEPRREDDKPPLAGRGNHSASDGNSRSQSERFDKCQGYGKPEPAGLAGRPVTALVRARLVRQRPVRVSFRSFFGRAAISRQSSPNEQAPPSTPTPQSPSTSTPHLTEERIDCGFGQSSAGTQTSSFSPPPESVTPPTLDPAPGDQENPQPGTESRTMKIVIIGATGTIGKAVVAALRGNHEIGAVSRSGGEHRADITDKASLERALPAIGKVDAIISAAGSAVFKPLAVLSDADFEKCLHDKLMGRVNVVRVGSQFVRSGGSITITSGVLAQEPMPGSAAISLVTSGLEGFGRAAALEVKGDKIR
jgi:hypothetical protein